MRRLNRTCSRQIVLGPLRTPAYRCHKPSGQAVVTLSGRDIYLGPWRSKASLVEYDRLIGEWLANGRQPLSSEPLSAIPLVTLLAAYLRHAKAYYRKDGQLTTSIHLVKVSLPLLRQRYEGCIVADFTPLSLKALIDQLIQEGWSRSYINAIAGAIRRTFKWGVANGLAPITTYQALLTVDGLRRGRSDARETPPIGPIADEVVEATLPHLSPVVADMIRLQAADWGPTSRDMPFATVRHRFERRDLGLSSADA